MNEKEDIKCLWSRDFIKFNLIKAKKEKMRWLTAKYKKQRIIKKKQCRKRTLEKGTLISRRNDQQEKCKINQNKYEWHEIKTTGDEHNH